MNKAKPTPITIHHHGTHQIVEKREEIGSYDFLGGSVTIASPPDYGGYEMTV